MEQNLDQVRQDLADIHDELLALPADAYDRRAQLKDKQNELRQLSSTLIEGKPLHDADALRSAFKRLEDVRDRLLDKHMDRGSTEATDTTIHGEFTAVVNRAMDAGLGIEEIEERMQKIISQMRSTG